MMWYGMTDDSMSFVLLVPVWMIACCAACFDSPPLLVHDAETAAAATSPLPLPPQPPPSLAGREWSRACVAGSSSLVQLRLRRCQEHGAIERITSNGTKAGHSLHAMSGGCRLRSESSPRKTLQVLESCIHAAPPAVDKGSLRQEAMALKAEKEEGAGLIVPVGGQPLVLALGILAAPPSAPVPRIREHKEGPKHKEDDDERLEQAQVPR